MGIPAYFSHIVRNYAEISLKLENFKKKQCKIDTNFYLDCNGIIYDCARDLIDNTKGYTCDFEIPMEFENELIRHVIRKIEEYVKDVSPSNTVFIAFDGVAPVAKLKQQRTRRFKAAYEHKVLGTGKTKWDTANITPGTQFMEFLTRKMNAHFGVKRNYIVSASDVAGEGEHKLFDHIRSHGHNTINIVYGLDADLIMLSLCNLQYAPLIYLYRETPSYIATLNAELAANEKYLFNIPMLSTLICDGKSTPDRVNDYVFLCFMLGNDFMPHIPSINIRHKGIHVLVNAYKKIACNLTENNAVVWKNVRRLIGLLAAQEQKNLQNEHESRQKFEAMKMKTIHSATISEKYNAIPVFNREIENLIDPTTDGWQSRYYRYLFAFDGENKSMKKNAAANYLEGLEWTFKYYTSGCPDWKWSYNYNYAPLLADILSECHYFNHEYFKSSTVNTAPISQQAQLMYVLPPDYHHILQTAGIHDMYKKLVLSGVLPELDCDALDFTWSYCSYMWEAHINLPKVDVDTLIL
jgi:5'-3' exonuclease